MPEQYTTRQLGFELEAAGAAYRIAHVYRDGPADKEWLGLKVGDTVLAIDGKAVRPPDNIWRTLNESLNEYVTVKVGSAADPKATRDVRIRTVPSLGDIKYEEWVSKNREFVEKATGGQIAYVHIRSMSAGPLKRFQNEVNEFWDRKGIIVDIRFNGGGNIDQELLDILERRPYQVLEQPVGLTDVGPAAAAGHCRAEGHADQLPIRLRQRGDAARVPPARPRPHRRQHHGRGRDRDRAATG